MSHRVSPNTSKKTKERRGARGKAGTSKLYAAIDLGTNNCRLLIVEATRNGFRVRDSFSRIVRLGEGFEKDGILSEGAMSRTLSALSICASKIRKAGVARVHVLPLKRAAMPKMAKISSNECVKKQVCALNY